MTNSKPQFVVDENGRRKAVLLSIKQYKELLSKIEDLEDALELNEAIRTSEGFKKHEEFMEGLKSEGLI